MYKLKSPNINKVVSFAIHRGFYATLQLTLTSMMELISVMFLIVVS